MNTRNFPILKFSFAVAAVSVVVYLLSFVGYIDAVNTTVLDALQGESDARQEIVIVGIDDESLAEIGSWPWDRSVFADLLGTIITQDPAVISLDVLFLEERSGDAEVTALLERSEIPVIFGSKFDDGELLTSVYDAPHGFVNFAPDPDGKIRKTIPVITNSDLCERSFSLRIMEAFLRIDEDNANCGDEIKLRTKTYSDTDQLEFAYTRHDFAYVPVKDVYNGTLEPGIFKDKIVLIGSTALDLRSNLNDNFVSVLGTTVPGVEIHANIVNSYLNDTFYDQPSIVLLGLLVAVISFAIAYVDFRSKHVLLGTLLLIVTLTAAFFATVIMFNFGWQLYFVQVAIGFITGYFASVILKYTLQNREARYVKKLFSRYLNEPLLELLIDDASRLSLGGETRDMSVLFSDIRGFTSISEKMTSEELITMVNDYLHFMTDIILAHNGTIDKYIGDAIMAFWNAPVDDDKHAIGAIKAALEMETKLSQFNNDFADYPEIAIGIGINSGDMTVGNVGGEQRFDYTVLGDNVNLGSRLEGLTKKYGVTTIISESTYQTAIKQTDDEDIIFRQIDDVIVKGKETPIKIYQPLKNTKENKTMIKTFAKGFKHYQAGEFADARKTFNQLTKDPVSVMLLDRMQQLDATDWKGIWRWTEK